MRRRLFACALLLCLLLTLGLTASAESAEESPARRAAALGLPEPPDIDIESWEFLYAGPTCGVGRYHPNITPVYQQYMDSRCADATRAFLDAAHGVGYTAYIGVGYRNWEYTTYWYEKEIAKWGSSYEAAQHGFAPGCSEHSTGLAFDLTDELTYWGDYNNRHDETVADTEVYQWMAEHCKDYGFIVRYPEGKEEQYHRACYPGHFRYVGLEAAAYITDNNLCLEEFLALYGKVYE